MLTSGRLSPVMECDGTPKRAVIKVEVGAAVVRLDVLGCVDARQLANHDDTVFHVPAHSHGVSHVQVYVTSKAAITPDVARPSMVNVSAPRYQVVMAYPPCARFAVHVMA